MDFRTDLVENGEHYNGNGQSICLVCLIGQLLLLPQVDCLSRRHVFDEAETLVNDFERRHAPYSAMYCK